MEWSSCFYNLSYSSSYNESFHKRNLQCLQNCFIKIMVNYNYSYVETEKESSFFRGFNCRVFLLSKYCEMCIVINFTNSSNFKAFTLWDIFFVMFSGISFMKCVAKNILFISSFSSFSS